MDKFDVNTYLDLINGTRCIIPKQQRGIICKQMLKRRESCNALIFGAGNDSIIWNTVNQGHTLFIEHDAKWANSIAAKVPGINIVSYDYNTQCDPKLAIHEQPAIDELSLMAHPVPKEITERKWDVILIDGPTGFDSNCPGRMLPIYWSSTLAHDACDIFVDDYSRPIEFSYTNKFLFHKYNRYRKFDARLHLLWLQADRIERR